MASAGAKNGRPARSAFAIGFLVCACAPAEPPFPGIAATPGCAVVVTGAISASLDCSVIASGQGPLPTTTKMSITSATHDTAVKFEFEINGPAQPGTYAPKAASSFDFGSGTISSLDGSTWSLNSFVPIGSCNVVITDFITTATIDDGSGHFLSKYVVHGTITATYVAASGPPGTVTATFTF